MPTPFEILFDPVSPAVLAMYGGLITLEAVFPARPLPRIPGWQARVARTRSTHTFGDAQS